ncbi:WhiB family transcriptional regulator, redox-sensing transcriptional regulator [Amycolatopsis sacchari]|uniref:Transcriptional regulator WhiB n=1 Tax=Amycolatopsis sacchari TaxID=115433 RepID=A0A1I3U1U7_9PSEU|nr:WhiB family transcriptional regulator [Amycolatopsis sacchari]SFJ76499.1 WhiB family transcriptional regulator, redox-sensing transcriptional regulator [Amycolatopsis sacchari]
MVTRPLSARGLTAARPFPALDPAGIGRDGEDLTWQRDAACRDADPALFFPERGTAIHRTIAAARQVCAACPVAADCRAFARRHHERFGIWGGETEQARPRPPRSRGTRPRRDRDARIARLTREGLTAEEIAARLDINPRTVHRARARQRSEPGATAA